MSLELLTQIYVAFIGLVVGSYLNVVIHRLPRRLSTVRPRSRCPRCRAAIRPWDNVPLVSFLLLRGQCRHCGARIAWRYPLVELATMACFLLVLERFSGRWIEVAVGCLFSAAMVALAMIDLDHYLLPDAITLPGIVAGLALQPWLSWASWMEALAGALLGAGFLYAVAWGWYLLRGVWGMGLGDVKMLAMVGAFLGWQGVVVTLLVSSLAGSVAGAALIVAGRGGLRTRLPFGVFLALGAFLALLVGGELIAAYLGLAARLG